MNSQYKENSSIFYSNNSGRAWYRSQQ